MMNDQLKRREFSLNESAGIAGVSRPTVCAWVKSGVIRTVDGRDNGRLNVTNLFAACVASSYRKLEYSWDHVAPVCRLLNPLTVQQIEQLFSDGKRFIVTAPGVVDPQFLADGEPFQGSVADMHGAIPIPVASHWQQFQAKLALHVRQQATALTLITQPARELEHA